jgi:hypothetical protein
MIDTVPGAGEFERMSPKLGRAEPTERILQCVRPKPLRPTSAAVS